MSLKQASLIFLFYLVSLTARSTHIVGGELNYAYLGGDSYAVTLTVIRDCYNSLTPFDQNASIGVFASNNAYLFQVLVPPTDSSILPNTASSPCLIAPNNICYTIAQYNTVINLPARAGGYQLAYQRCCRNHTIANVANVAQVGATYYATVPDRSIAAVNSNPVFTQLPSTFICRNEPFVFQNSATDADGDSLVYQMCMPLNGGSQGSPVPQPPAQPPYDSIIWQPPYNLSNIMGGVPMAINSVTGTLSATPSFLGQFVYGVSVKEYRNGVYLGETRRDFQVNVVNCPKIVTSVIQAPVYQCGNLAVNFLNNSVGANAYQWDFGVAALGNDTSVQASPQFQFPDTGLYNVSLVAISSFNSSCRDTSHRQVQLYPALNADFGHTITACNDTVGFTDQSSLITGPIINWDWDFGDGVHAHSATPTHTYARGGLYNVHLDALSQQGCTDGVDKTIFVPLIPEADFQAFTDSCHPEVTLVNHSALGAAFQWSFGDGTIASTPSAIHIYKEEGEYVITLITGSESNCYDTITKTIRYEQYEKLAHYIPNSFTPNGDGRNDVFDISGASACEEVEMLIFDRWGRLVYETNNLSSFWDGTSDGENVQQGVYVYFLKGKDYTRKGTITLIR